MQALLEDSGLVLGEEHKLLLGMSPFTVHDYLDRLSLLNYLFTCSSSCKNEDSSWYNLYYDIVKMITEKVS